MINTRSIEGAYAAKSTGKNKSASGNAKKSAVATFPKNKATGFLKTTGAKGKDSKKAAQKTSFFSRMHTYTGTMGKEDVEITTGGKLITGYIGNRKVYLTVREGSSNSNGVITGYIGNRNISISGTRLDPTSAESDVLSLLFSYAGCNVDAKDGETGAAKESKKSKENDQEDNDIMDELEKNYLEQEIADDGELSEEYAKCYKEEYSEYI